VERQFRLFVCAQVNSSLSRNHPVRPGASSKSSQLGFLSSNYPILWRVIIVGKKPRSLVDKNWHPSTVFVQLPSPAFGNQELPVWRDVYEGRWSCVAPYWTEDHTSALRRFLRSEPMHPTATGAMAEDKGKMATCCDAQFQVWLWFAIVPVKGNCTFIKCSL